jgi:hypothetical protein
MFFIYDLFNRRYDLAEESQAAGFRKNVDHFKSYLEYCPKFAISQYGQAKYDALRKQIGLPKFQALSV